MSAPMAQEPLLGGESGCYRIVRDLLRQGRRDRAFVVIGELLRTDSGRPHALRLLAEIYGNALSPPKVTAPEQATAPIVRILKKA